MKIESKSVCWNCTKPLGDELFDPFVNTYMICDQRCDVTCDSCGAWNCFTLSVEVVRFNRIKCSKAPKFRTIDPYNRGPGLAWPYVEGFDRTVQITYHERHD